MAAAVAGPRALGDEELVERLLALVVSLNLNEDRMAAAMDPLPRARIP